MTKKIQPSEATLKPIRDSGAFLPRIEPAQVREKLAADTATERLTETLAPVTLFALREELINRLQSSGGRPGLTGTTRRAKVPLSDEQWEKLEEIAAAIGTPGFAPSAGQVASVLVTLSLQSVASRLASESFSSQLTRDLQDLAKRCR